MILHTMTEIQKAGFALFLNRRHLSTHDEVHRIEVVWCAMRKNWQGLALKLMRWIEGRSLCSAILCFIDSILSDVSFQHLHCFIDSQMSVFNISIASLILRCQFSTSPLMSTFQTSNLLSIQKFHAIQFHHGASCHLWLLCKERAPACTPARENPPNVRHG